MKFNYSIYFCYDDKIKILFNWVTAYVSFFYQALYLPDPLTYSKISPAFRSQNNFSSKF